MLRPLAAAAAADAEPGGAPFTIEKSKGRVRGKGAKKVKISFWEKKEEKRPWTHLRASSYDILFHEVASLVRVAYVLESLGGILAGLSEKNLVTSRMLPRNLVRTTLCKEQGAHTPRLGIGRSCRLDCEHESAR
jgi:hypothetical protein